MKAKIVYAASMVVAYTLYLTLGTWVNYRNAKRR
jgi:hypothetical protein